MLFSSVIFLFVFLPVVLVLYYLPFHRLKNPILLLASLFFYAYGGPAYLLVMLGSIFMNYIFGLLVDRYREIKWKAQLVLTVTVAANIAVIGYYKYMDFLIGNINGLFHTDIPMRHIVMPIGISFFTFHCLSYVIDIYRQHGKVLKNPLNVALYISLFPQLVAGPIIRYETVADQINERGRNQTVERFSSGVERFILGLSKKVIIANSVGLIADEIFGRQTQDLSTVLAWIGIFAYTVQIYFDFSGYSDMAIGLGRMFGFEFPENFMYPYISKTISEFWRRWHISLSTFFRDYVYIPLGGNRVSTLKFLRNIFVVWFLTGLWHGAAWNFVAWGLYFGTLLAIEKFLIGAWLKRLWAPFQHAYAMLFVMFGWVLFRSDTFTYALSYLKVLVGIGENNLVDAQAMYYLSTYKIELALALIASFPLYPKAVDMVRKMKAGYVKSLLYYIKPLMLGGLFLICIMYLINSTFNPFIYFRF